MEKTMKEEGVTAIVPCYNEAPRIGSVLETLLRSPFLTDIVVVDNGSDDTSAQVIRRYPVKMMQVKKNIGKSGAVQLAAGKVRTPYIFLTDGDNVGLREKHVEQLVREARLHHDALVIGVRDTHRFFPFLIEGDRIIRAEHLRNVLRHPLCRDFGLEPVMNHYCKRHGIPLRLVRLVGVRNPNKWKKWENGYLLLWKEYADLSLIYARLYTGDLSVPDMRRMAAVLRQVTPTEQLARLRGIVTNQTRKRLQQVQRIPAAHVRRIANKVKKPLQRFPTKRIRRLWEK